MSYNPEFEGEEVNKQGVKDAMGKILSVPNDPYFFLNKIKRYFTITSIREALTKVGGIKELEQMLYDPHIKSAMTKRKAGIRGAKIKFISEDDAELEFLDKTINQNHVDFILKNMWETWFYGYSVDELIWEEFEDVIRVKDMRKVPFYWFKPASDLKSVFYSKQLAVENDVRLDKPATYGKYLLNISDGSYKRPHGMGVAFCIYFISKFKEMGWSFWGEWLQKYASGFIMAEIPSDQKEEMSQFAKDLKEAIRGAAIVYPEGSNVRIEWPSSSGDQFKVFRDSAVDDINLAILGETLTSKVEGGSRAAATVHDSIQKEIIQLDMSLAQEALNRLIEYTYVLNLRDVSKAPKAEVYFERALQQERADRDETLSRTNPGIKFTKTYMMESYGFGEEDLEESAIEPVESSFSHSGHSHTFADETTDELLAILRRSKFGMDELDVLAAIEVSKNEKELAKNLEALMDIDTGKFEDDFSKATFYSLLEGVVNATK